VVAGFPEPGLWFHYAVGLVFGALVLAPYATRRQRLARVLLLAVASAAIYRLAVKFVADGPLGYEAVTSFILAGAGAALLCGLAVVLIAPRRFGWRLVLLAIPAGALGGAAFDLKFAFDPHLLIGHAAWQLLTCLALHFGLRDSPGPAAVA
jgi:hypothetical protein